MELKEEFCELLMWTKRDGIENLIQRMEQDGFFTAPCSGGNHLAQEGGLLLHSMNVWSVANKLAYRLLPEEDYNESRSSVIVTSLLHDLGKMGNWGKPNYVPNILKSGKPSDSKPYVTNPDALYVPHEVHSLTIASKYIDLTEGEYFAIAMHNGMYGDLKYAIKGHETRLYMILHFADMWASRAMEMGVR